MVWEIPGSWASRLAAGSPPTAFSVGGRALPAHTAIAARNLPGSHRLEPSGAVWSRRIGTDPAGRTRVGEVRVLGEVDLRLADRSHQTLSKAVFPRIADRHNVSRQARPVLGKDSASFAGSRAPSADVRSRSRGSSRSFIVACKAHPHSQDSAPGRRERPCQTPSRIRRVECHRIGFEG